MAQAVLEGAPDAALYIGSHLDPAAKPLNQKLPLLLPRSLAKSPDRP